MRSRIGKSLKFIVSALSISQGAGLDNQLFVHELQLSNDIYCKNDLD